MLFSKVIQYIIRFRAGIILLLAIGLAISACQIVRHISIDNSLSIWFLDNNPAYQEYLVFQEQQGSDQIIVIMVPTDDPFSKEHIDKLKKLHVASDSLSYIHTTLSLANAQYPLYANNKLYFRDIYSVDRNSEWMNNLLDDLPEFKKQLITPDQSFTFFYLQLNSGKVIEKNRREYIKEITELIRKTLGPVRITGPPILNEAFSVSIYKESNFFAVMTVLMIITLLFFLLPHWSYIPIAFSSVLITTGITLGLMVTFGHSLNLISMLIPTILMVYCISDSVHVINIFHKHRNEFPNQNRETQIIQALNKSLQPCFYTTLTTIIGYLALSLSPLPAFKVTGFYTSLGICIAFFAVYITTAIGFYYLSKKSSKAKVQRINLSYIISKINNWTSHQTNYILGLGGLAFIVGLIAISNIEVNSNPIHLLGEGTVKEDLILIEDKLGGSSRLQININRLDNKSILNKSTFLKLDTFQNQLNKNNLLANPVSILNFKKFLEDRVPLFFRMQSIDFNKILADTTSSPNPFFTLLSKDLSTIAVTINIKEIETKKLQRLLKDITTTFTSTFPKSEFGIKIHGFPAVYAQINTFILQTQLYSFGAAFLLSFCILFYFIGDFKISLLALIPNLLPLCLTAIVMAVFRIDLDSSNAMLAPIMLGVAMDDTIHLMNKYKAYKEMGHSVTDSLDRALSYTGPALVSTTIALLCGFLIVGFSGVPSVSTFGLLCAFTILAALLADAIVLPALIKKFA